MSPAPPSHPPPPASPPSSRSRSSNPSLHSRSTSIDTLRTQTNDYFYYPSNDVGNVSVPAVPALPPTYAAMARQHQHHHQQPPYVQHQHQIPYPQMSPYQQQQQLMHQQQVQQEQEQHQQQNAYAAAHQQQQQRRTAQAPASSSPPSSQDESTGNDNGGLHRRAQSQRSISSPRSSISTTRTLALDANNSPTTPATNNATPTSFFTRSTITHLLQQQSPTTPPPAYLALRGAVIGMDLQDPHRRTRKRKTFTVHIYPWDSVTSLRERIAGLLRVEVNDISLFQNKDTTLTSHTDSRLDWSSESRLRPADVKSLFPGAEWMDKPLLTVAEVFEGYPPKECLNIIVSVNRETKVDKEEIYKEGGFYNYHEETTAASRSLEVKNEQRRLLRRKLGICFLSLFAFLIVAAGSGVGIYYLKQKLDYEAELRADAQWEADQSWSAANMPTTTVPWSVLYPNYTPFIYPTAPLTPRTTTTPTSTATTRRRTSTTRRIMPTIPVVGPVAAPLPEPTLAPPPSFPPVESQGSGESEPDILVDLLEPTA
ncbi:hypothetical protein HDV05_004122 [Chytridiales sp. JEL 0842]|nr:hypothetical protein HDV05_004122 [Chytridiales sp. JEL 0842]